MISPAGTSHRLDGLDLARYLALAGMIMVNFHLAIHPVAPGPDWLQWLFSLLEGKASATFVVLAGIGLALATRVLPLGQAYMQTARRSLFLLLAGLLNLTIFPADIIHYYAIYFLLALPWLRAGKATLCLVITAVAATSLWALLHLDYSQGWDWTTLHYEDLWTPNGFLTNLLFNGFHPVLPWMAFLLYGMLLARLPLQHPRTQTLLTLAGLSAIGTALLAHQANQAQTWAWLVETTPMPPGPAYLLMGIGAASLCIGACLRTASLWPRAPWRYLLPAGRMTLTIYLAHILLGMGLLEAMGALNGSWSLTATAMAAVVFLAAATAAAHAWSRRMSHGPIELLMRRLTTTKQAWRRAPAHHPPRG